MREKVGKSRNTVFFQWFGAPEGRKVGSLKRRVRSQLARWEMKSCTPLWREAHLEVKMLKTPGVLTTFGSCDVEKVHAVVARSTLRSQNAQKTHQRRTTFGSCDVEKVHAVVARSPCFEVKMHKTHYASDHFWQLRCWKSARRCGANHISKSKCTKHTHASRPLLEVRDVEKVHAVVVRIHISKSKCTKHHMFAPLLEVRMLKKCTPLWREGHFEVKMFKTLGVRTTFGGSDVASLQYTTLQDITLHYTPVHYITLHYTPVHSTTLNYTTPHYITLNDTATQIDR